MAKDKKSFLLYCDVHHTVKKLSDEQAGKLFKHVLSYVNDENPDTDDIIIQIAFEPIKQQLKRDLKRYESVCQRNKTNIEKRWADRKDDTKNTTGINGIPEIPNDTKNTDNDIDTDTDIDTDKKKRKRFIPPLLSEVKKYFDENGYSEESAIKAFNYYTTGDWIDSKGNKVRNWKGKMITVWFKPENKKKPSFIMP